MKNLITIQVLDSKAIKSIMFDKSKSQMLIKFSNSPLYTYDNVSESFFNLFASAKSKGSFYHKNIKPVYQYSQRLDN